MGSLIPKESRENFIFKVSLTKLTVKFNLKLPWCKDNGPELTAWLSIQVLLGPQCSSIQARQRH